MLQKKNIPLGKNKIIYLGLIIYFFIYSANSFSTENIVGKYVEIKILDKVNSKNSTLNIEVGKEKKFKNLSIKALMCINAKNFKCSLEDNYEQIFNNFSYFSSFRTK